MDEPSRRPPALKTLARALTAEAVDALAGIMRSGASEHARIAAATAILDRAHGKPAQGVKAGGDETGAPILVRWADTPSEATPDPCQAGVATPREPPQA